MFETWLRAGSRSRILYKGRSEKRALAVAAVALDTMGFFQATGDIQVIYVYTGEIRRNWKFRSGMQVLNDVKEDV